MIYRICENFHWLKFSPSPATFVLFCGKFFTHAVKVAISSMQSLTQDKKNLRVKFLPMRAGGEIGENFLLVKISTYMVL